MRYNQPQMKNILRKIFPQVVINYLWHLPRAVFANIKYGFPSRGLTVVGVTGTDGKTTTVNMVYRILKTAGKKVSMVSTINAVVGGREIDTGFHVTSPDPMMVQKLLKQSADRNDEYAILEVTSHALDQFRFWGVKFHIGVITNITHEHLDYHKTWENYFKAKLGLILNSELSIINAGEKHFKRLADLSGGQVVSFGLSKNADFHPGNFPLKLRIPGEFNLCNALAAAATAKNLKIDQKVIKSSLENFKALIGRMEEAPNKRGLKIMIDFAHTPNGLENALKTLRKGCKGKLIAVFGCAGKRDGGKRFLMGEIAAKLADTVIITAEDPRGQIDMINTQIMEGVRKTGKLLNKDVFIENDRQKAIGLAINKIAKRGDTVGIFGKGHEKSMNIDGKQEVAWSDYDAVLKAQRL